MGLRLSSSSSSARVSLPILGAVALACAVGLTVAPAASAAPCSDTAVTVTPMHSPNGTQRPFYADFKSGSTKHSGYVGYELSGADLGADVWVRLTNFAGGALGLGTHQSASIATRSTSAAGKPLVYAYLKASAATTTAQTFSVEVWNGRPGQAGSSLVCTASDGFNKVIDVQNANANKITSIAVSDSAPALGGTVAVTAVGNTGTMGAGDASDQVSGRGVFSMAPAMDDSWPADAFALTGVEVTMGSLSARDALRVYPTSSAASDYTAVYRFAIRSTTSAATPVLPVQNIASGTQVKYTGSYPATVTQIAPPTLTTTIVKSPAGITGPPYRVTYQVRVTNSAASPVTLDYLRDTPTPRSGWELEPGSATRDGAPLADPVLDGGTLVFGGPFEIPARSSGTDGALVFRYVLELSGEVANAVVGKVGDVEVGASSGGNEVVVDPTEPVVVTGALPGAIEGEPYSETLEATAGAGGYVWTIESGSLPAGLSLSSAGVLSGTPTGGGSTFTVRVTDADGGSSTRAFTLAVEPAGGPADTAAPAGSVSLGATVTASTSVTATLAATDDTGVTAYRAALGADCSAAAWVGVAAATPFSVAVGLTLPAGDGDRTVCAQFRDDAGNESAVATATIALDTTRPALVLSTAAPDPTNGAFAVTATFSEDVTGFDASDVVAGNGTVSGLAGSGSTYTFTVTPTAAGPVTVDVAADAASDAAGNGSTAAATLTRTIDLTRPSVALSTAAADPVTGAFTVTATFSEDVSGFDASDVAVGNGAVSGFAGSGGSYSFTVTPAADGAVTVDVGADAAADAAGNGSTAATQLTRLADVGAPEVVLATDAPDPVSGSFAVTATFSEAVTGFDVSDVSVGNGAASGFSGSGASYSFTVVPAADGPVTVEVAAGAAVDAAGNASLAATRLERLHDATPPTVAVAERPPATTADSTATIAFAADEDVTVECSLDGGAFAPCASPLELTGLAPGAHTLKIRTVDTAGNDRTTTVSWTVQPAVAGPSAPAPAPSGGSRPEPTVVIVPTIRATDLAGRPQAFRQSTDPARSAGPFTRTLDVQLRIPSPEGVELIYVSNFADFRDVRVLAVTPDRLYDWRLLAGPSGDRPVWIRYEDSPDAPVGRATIVLDQELPRLKPRPLRPAKVPAAAKRASAAACGGAPRRWLDIRERDGFSGLNAVQIASDRRRPCAWRPYLPVISYRLPGNVVWVRVADRVGNVGPWYRVRVG